MQNEKRTKYIIKIILQFLSYTPISLESIEFIKFILEPIASFSVAERRMTSTYSGEIP